MTDPAGVTITGAACPRCSDGDNGWSILNTDGSCSRCDRAVLRVERDRLRDALARIPARRRNADGDKFLKGDRVVARNGDQEFPGVVDAVYDSDQGDFEYYVNHDDGTGSFWPVENLTR